MICKQDLTVSPITCWMTGFDGVDWVLGWASGGRGRKVSGEACLPWNGSILGLNVLDW